MEGTWVSRELPVLDAVVTLLDDGRIPANVTVTELAGHTGMDPVEIARALQALNGPYLDLQTTLATIDDPGSWFAKGVTPEARRAVGQWPTADSLITRLVDGFNAAAEREPDPERKSRLRAIASGLGGSVRDVAVDIVARVIEHRTGLG
jgi:hypothetical protein